jgi:hypothetical protein
MARMYALGKARSEMPVAGTWEMTGCPVLHPILDKCLKGRFGDTPDLLHDGVKFGN